MRSDSFQFRFSQMGCMWEEFSMVPMHQAIVVMMAMAMVM